MQFRRHTDHARRAVLTFGLVLVAACGGGRDLDAEFDALIEAGDFDEVLAHVEVLKEEGVNDPALDFAEGYALLQQGADAAAEAPLDRVLASRPDRGPQIAAVYEKLAWKDHEDGWDDRAKRRMARAVTFDPSIDPGALRDPAADHFYRMDRDYARALPLYDRLVEELPEPVSKHPEWFYRYGYCLQEVGRDDEALDVYAEFIERFPSNLNFMRFVQWRRMQLRIERAEARLGTADPEGALEELASCLDSQWHLELRQQARLIAGRAEEARGNLEAARAWYAEVVDAGNEFGGEVVREADERLRALGDMGVH